MRGWTGYVSIAQALMRSIATATVPGMLPRQWPGRARAGKPVPGLLLGTALLLAGCGDIAGPAARPGFTDATVTQVQACAIGYDLARQVHDRISLRHTVLLAPSRATPCEAHALAYLRRAGFGIDETGRGGARFTIALSRLDRETLSAVARVGDDLTIARLYRPVRTGVVACGPVSVQHLDPESFARRDAKPEAGS